MFSTLGKLVSRAWPLLLVGWIVALVGLKLVAPPWKEVAANGEFAFLPETVPSRLGEKLFREAWEEPFASNVVVIVRRESSEEGLLETDKLFIEDELRPRLEKIATEEAASLHAQPLMHKQARKNSDTNEADVESPSARSRTSRSGDCSTASTTKRRSFCWNCRRSFSTRATCRSSNAFKS
jgi:hypothetical protein